MSLLSIYPPEMDNFYFNSYCRGVYTMCARGTLACFYLLVSVVHCSSIFTRSMIRMPSQPYSSSVTDISKNASSEPMILTSKSDDERFEIIYPVKLTQQQIADGESPTLIEEIESKKGTSSHDELQPMDLEANSTSSVVDSLDQFQLASGNSERNLMNRSVPSEELKSDKSTLINIWRNIVKNVASGDWKSEKNASSNLIDSFDFLGAHSLSPDTEKGFQGLNLWIVVQRFFNCGWSSRWLSCIQESFSTTSDDDSFFLPSFLVPRVPSTELDEESSDHYARNKDKFDLDSHDEDEGRKRLSKKLMSLLPLLLMLKMSMVPALAIMAIVSGKAFLMSLISLGVALFSAVLSPKGVLSASKRNEMAAQSPISPDQPPSNYYYMM